MGTRCFEAPSFNDCTVDCDSHLLIKHLQIRHGNVLFGISEGSNYKNRRVIESSLVTLTYKESK
jgi:hypothetical protein